MRLSQEDLKETTRSKTDEELVELWRRGGITITSRARRL
jgi:hypothetical protein